MTKFKIQNKFKDQISNPKTKFLLFVICALVFFCHFNFDICHLYAQADNERLVILTKQIIEASADLDLYSPFEELKSLYFKDHRYPEFIELVKSLSDTKRNLAAFTNYYIALARYTQLRHLEETKNWEEYFAQGDSYRTELVGLSEKTIASVAPTDPLNIYAKLLLFKFHRDQEDTSGSQAQEDLVKAILGYPKNALYLLPLKEIADQLLLYNDKVDALAVYKIYIESVVASGKKDEELKDMAQGFYNEKNMELAETIYDLYIDRINSSYPKEKLIPLLTDIAKTFSFKDNGSKDPLYAEKIFKKIEEAGGGEAFDEELMYLRAFNLEKIKEYSSAANIYSGLVGRFAQGAHTDEANFKIGIIYTYVLADTEKGKNYFAQLAQKETSNPHVIASLYQLGLLAQWEQDFAKASEYYNQLLNKAGGNFVETENLTRERLNEISQNQPIEYNLKTFLDLSLKKEGAQFNSTKISLGFSLYRVNMGTDIRAAAAAFGIDSGSVPVQVQYLWSGDLGTAKQSCESAAFDVVYKQAGTKVISLVAVSPTGVIDKNIDIIDVY